MKSESMNEEIYLRILQAMEKNQSTVMEKLEVFGILRESLKIPYNNPKLIFLTFITSLPLIFLMVLHEIILQTTMIQTKTFLTPPHLIHHLNTHHISYYYLSKYSSLETSVILFQSISSRVFQLGVLYFVPLHLLDLINTIVTVNSVSAIYAQEKHLSIKEMLYRLTEGKRFKGPLITSVYVLALNSLFLFGFIWAVTNSVVISLSTFFVVIYGIVSMVLLMKWIEWSALWNMGIVLSVLEERSGIEALAVSGYFSRGNKRRGLYLMSIFFVWRIALRLPSVYVGGQEKWGALVATSVLSCAGNVMKWVVCTVYFYDCKKRVLEKKVDVEEGRTVGTANMDLVLDARKEGEATLYKHQLTG